VELERALAEQALALAARERVPEPVQEPAPAQVEREREPVERAPALVEPVQEPAPESGPFSPAAPALMY